MIMLFDQHTIGMHFISMATEPRTFVQQLRFWGAIAGAMTPIATICGFIWSKLISPVLKKIKSIYDTVGELATNHIPHIQKSLEAQDIVLGDLKRDMQSTKQEVGTLKETVATLRKPHARRK